MFKWLGTTEGSGFTCNDWETFDFPAYISFLTRAFEVNTKENLLYIGSVGSVATWDGANFALHTGNIRDSGDTMDQEVRTITFYKGELVIGGEFELVDGLPVKGVARYHEDPDTGIFSWEQLGQGLDSVSPSNRVVDLRVVNKKLFACGQFIKDGDGEKMVSLAVLNPSTEKWEAVDDQTDIIAASSFVFSLGSYSKSLKGGQ